MMIGGVDTTSFAMAFSLAVICHYPEWQKKMGEEIDNFVKEKGRMPMYSERTQLPNVLAVLKETVRYRPSGYLGIAHRATEDSKSSQTKELKLSMYFFFFFSYL